MGLRWQLSFCSTRTHEFGSLKSVEVLEDIFSYRNISVKFPIYLVYRQPLGKTVKKAENKKIGVS